MSDVLSSPMSHLIPEKTGSGGYSERDAKVVTPFSKSRTGVDVRGVPGEVLDHNDSCPSLTKPHAMGPDTIPLVFFTETPGDGSGASVNLNTPMQHNIPVKGLK